MPIAHYYFRDPNAPKPNMPVHYGANLWISCQGRLLLEQRTDCGKWGLIGGGRKTGETDLQAAMRELREETGLKPEAAALHFVRVYDDPGRIAAYRDGSVWQMVIALFAAELKEEPALRVSRESSHLQFFSKEELKALPIAETHQELIDDYLKLL